MGPLDSNPKAAVRSGLRGADGFALIAVMGALAILFIVALSLDAVLSREIVRAHIFKSEVQAGLAVRSAAEKALAMVGRYAAAPGAVNGLILNNPGDFKDIKVGPALAEISYIALESKKVYGLQDEEGKININTASENLLASFEPVGPKLAGQIVKRRARKKFEVIEELLSLEGVSGSLFFGTGGRLGLRDLLTIWGEGKININTAAEEVLGALPGIDPKKATALVEIRKGPDGKLGTEDDGIRDLGALFGRGMIEERYRAELTGLVKLKSNVFSLRANARIGSGPKPTVHKSVIAVLDSSAERPRIVYWRKL